VGFEVLADMAAAIANSSIGQNPSALRRL
jgi:hypothetical protein